MEILSCHTQPKCSSNSNKKTIFVEADAMLSNHPGGALIEAKILDWMSYNLAGREKYDWHHFILNLFNTCFILLLLMRSLHLIDTPRFISNKRSNRCVHFSTVVENRMFRLHSIYNAGQLSPIVPW